SDRGLQYASQIYVSRLQQHGLVPSMSRPANPYDNASCESFMRTLKREEIRANQYRDLEHLRAQIAEFIEQYYNRLGLHSALGYRPPEEFEQAEAVAGGAGAVMSFLGMGRSIHPMRVQRLTGNRPQPAPRPIVWMSLRLGIPWQVALQQSLPPLPQPGTRVT